MKILRHGRRTQTFFVVVIGVKTSIQQCKNTLLLLKQIHSKCKSTDVAILRNILLGGGACLSIYLSENSCLVQLGLESDASKGC